MRTLKIGLACLGLAVAFASATPASAQSGNFYFGFGWPGPRWDYGRHYPRDDWRWRHYSHRYSYGYPRNWGHVARCEARYRSYDRSSDTFVGYDGRRHRCRL